MYICIYTHAYICTYTNSPTDGPQACAYFSLCTHTHTNIFMYIPTYIHTQVDSKHVPALHLTYIHTHMHTHIYTRGPQACFFLSLHTYILTYTRTYTQVDPKHAPIFHAWARMEEQIGEYNRYVYACMHLCICICMCICMYVHWCQWRSRQENILGMYMHACMYMYMYVCVYVFLYGPEWKSR
jgi:hypothetical protein